MRLEKRYVRVAVLTHCVPTDGFFHFYVLNKSICHFRGVRSILLLLFYFWWKILLANNVDPDQMPYDPFKGFQVRIDTLSGEAGLPFSFLHPFSMGVICKRKEFAPIGVKF